MNEVGIKRLYTPGVYDLTNNEYHSSGGVSRSGIIEFKRSPKHYWHRYLNPLYQPKKSTPEMEFGTAFHCFMLEPARFDEEYIVAPDKRGNLPEELRLKDVGREAYESAKKSRELEKKKRELDDISFQQFSLGKNIISKENLAQIRIMYNSIISDEQALQVVFDGKNEKSIYWIDEDTGLLCKCRPDIWHENFVVDLKTTKDASFRSFQRDFYSSGYHIQLAMIHLGVKSVTGNSIMDFIDFAIEKEEPYCHAIYPIDEAALQFGIDEFKHYLSKMKECFDKNEWPGYSTQTITLPAYATIGE